MTYRELMRCLGERGRTIRHYQELVELLREELGSTPMAETTVLYELLRRDEEA